MQVQMRKSDESKTNVRARGELEPAIPFARIRVLIPKLASGRFISGPEWTGTRARTRFRHVPFLRRNPSVFYICGSPLGSQLGVVLSVPKAARTKAATSVISNGQSRL